MSNNWEEMYVELWSAVWQCSKEEYCEHDEEELHEDAVSEAYHQAKNVAAGAKRY
jgi:hypothetical protein